MTLEHRSGRYLAVTTQFARSRALYRFAHGCSADMPYPLHLDFAFVEMLPDQCTPYLSCGRSLPAYLSYLSPSPCDLADIS